MAILSVARSTLSAMVRPFGYELSPIVKGPRVSAEQAARPQQFSHIDPILEQAEARARLGDFDGMLTSLQQLSLGDFAWLLVAPPPHLSAMTSMLPRMASKDVQLHWTGTSGPALLLQSLLFVKSIEAAFPRFLGRELHGATMLDFGCGWGRLIRLMLWFSHPQQIYGVDPCDKSLEVCANDRVPGNLALSEWVPRNLPFDGVRFDLIYAFSVFTHLSERTMMAAQSAIRPRIKQDGLFVMTIRPIEYWESHSIHVDSKKYADVLNQHKVRGFAFVPQVDSPVVEGDATYGDASMTLNYIKERWDSWHLCGYDHNVQDQQQITVFLKPV
ncbi:MAG TPA: class I SAM-dependent methyltransferase [Vicinamibacterales bacterium]|nr:class I SAM-dependent methyltransferase [Vicinamibacterales bacterium]